jgi:outer membrane lipoprotein-sorting protein
VDFGGIQFATFQDFYRDGKQSARVSFDTVTFNEAVPDKLFTKPISIKEVK